MQRLQQVAPLCRKKEPSTRDALHWCVCAIWSSSIEAKRPMELGPLLGAAGIKCACSTRFKELCGSS